MAAFCGVSSTIRNSLPDRIHDFTPAPLIAPFAALRSKPLLSGGVAGPADTPGGVKRDVESARPGNVAFTRASRLTAWLSARRNDSLLIPGRSEEKPSTVTLSPGPDFTRSAFAFCKAAADVASRVA